MSIFIGSNAGETITPDFVSPTVTVLGTPKKPSSASDLILAGGGDDTVAGGGGNDIAFLGEGNDAFLWHPGDGNDIVDGGAGTDRLHFDGSAASESIAVSAGPLGLAQVTRDVGNVSLNLISVERIEIATFDGQDRITVNNLASTDVRQVAIDLAGTADPSAGDGQVDSVTVNGTAAADQINLTMSGTQLLVSGLAATTAIDHADANLDQLLIGGGAGNDRIDASGVQIPAIRLTLDGGAGNDTLVGSGGADLLLGGDGNDIVTGGRGSDTALLGAGDDRFIWNPGDGSDVVEGQAGIDTMQFNGANVSENIDISANGARARLFRDVANITMDVDGVEHIDFAALGGADNVVVDDLTGTDVTQVNVDLAATLGGTAGDGQADRVTVNGTAGADNISVALAGDALVVDGLSAQVRVSHADAGIDVVAVAGGAGTDTLQVNGADTSETVSIIANGTQVRVSGIDPAQFDIDATVESIVINGNGGDDTIVAGNGLAALTQLTIDGGAGNDVVTGGDGADLLLGGDGNDVVTGGRGSDVALLGAGDDTFVWNPGDGSDTVEGQDGVDTLQFNGSNVGEKIDISANGERVRFFRDVGNVTMDLNGVEHVNFLGLGGADNIAIHDLTATHVTEVNIDLGTFGGTADGQADLVTIDATAGNDSIDVDASAASVSVTGLSAAVTVRNFDDSDELVINGLEGDDSVSLHGSDASENVDIVADGNLARLFTDAAHLTTETSGVEHLGFAALGGADIITVNDLGGTDVTQVAIDLAATLGGSAGDGIQDRVTVVGTAGDDSIHVSEAAGTIKIEGLAAAVTIDHADSGLDSLTLLGGAGSDAIDASALPAGTINLQLNGGDGDDLVIGSQGDDLVLGGRGNDTALMGAGDDTFVWNPGDGSDIVEGQAGTDTLQFNGANVSENVDISANGERVRFTRDVASITMDLNGVERINFSALGGADKIHVADMTGTVLKQAAIDLGASGGVPDGQADEVTVDGTAGADTVKITGAAGSATVTGLPEQVSVDHADAGLDSLVVKAGAGDDVIDGSQVGTGTVKLTLDGGDGDDLLIGSTNGDILRGGAGDDILIGNGGNDVLDGGTGNNVLIGGGGNNVFVHGNVTIQDFHSGTDKIDLQGVAGATDFASCMAHAQDVGGNVIMDFGAGEHITIANAACSSLHASDFLL